MTKLQEISQWLLNEGSGFLEALLFEAINVSRRLSRLEYDDGVVHGLDARFYVDFLSPIAKEQEEGNFTFERVTIEFNVERHGPIYLQYELDSLAESAEKVIERATLLDSRDCCHMEGPSYEDLDAIRWIMKDRLMTLADGKEITNYGVMSTLDQGPIIKEIKERYFNRSSEQKEAEE